MSESEKQAKVQLGNGSKISRCFITGEYCSQQLNIKRQRDRLHHSQHINAFVIMSFSDMSDVVYQWKLKPFIESLGRFLTFDQDTAELTCHSNANHYSQKGACSGVHAIRADTDPASNYIICSRICQQIQIADLIIVDVSNRNPNVYYEFGIALALGKLILPICLSDSYFKKIRWSELIVDFEAYKGSFEELKDINGRHVKDTNYIGLYPWRKQLFEHYGIVYSPGSNADISNPQYEPAVYFDYDTLKDDHFPDSKYHRFPYQVEVGKEERKEKIGRRLYDKLTTSYARSNASLILYSLDHFINEHDAGACVITYHNEYVKRISDGGLFNGDRVAVLAQHNSVLSKDKDTSDGTMLEYSFADMLLIGVNQATYEASDSTLNPSMIRKTAPEKKPGSSTSVTSAKPDSDPISSLREEIDSYIKRHLKNRGMLIYPQNPLYVDRYNAGLHPELKTLLEGNEKNLSSEAFFCLNDIMTNTVRYAEHVVIDTSNNDLLSLLWLGIAHGFGVYAIRVLREYTSEEQQDLIAMQGEVPKQRNIFDVSGLWTAIFQSNDSNGFYAQLKMVEMGIERHARLLDPCTEMNIPSEEAKIVARNETLESYYRRRFWMPIIHAGNLRILVPAYYEWTDKAMSYSRVGHWDFQAISNITHYLSKHTVIGEYLLDSIVERKVQSKPDDTDDSKKDHAADHKNQPISPDINCVYIGDEENPATRTFIEKLSKTIREWHARQPITGASQPLPNILHESMREEYPYPCETPSEGTDMPKLVHKVLRCALLGNGCFCNNEQCTTWCSVDTLIPTAPCILKHSCVIRNDIDCKLAGANEHEQFARLIFWKTENHPHDRYEVAIAGTSGPSTKALSTLLIDELNRVTNPAQSEQEAFMNKYQLRDLQDVVYRRIMDTFLNELDIKMSMHLEKDKMQEGEQPSDRTTRHEEYKALVKYALKVYWAEALFKVFLPLMTGREVTRILNGLHTYVHTSKFESRSPFDLNFPDRGVDVFEYSTKEASVAPIIEDIPLILARVIKSYMGMEALYRITVRHRKNGSSQGQPLTEDDRVITKIELYETSNQQGVFCFFDPEKFARYDK